MQYNFEILGVSPILEFFNHEQSTQHPKAKAGVEYVGSFQCTLDAFLQSVETVPPKRGWHQDSVVDTVINFWLNNSEIVQHWRSRLRDAGNENLLVARLSDVQSIRNTFESLLG